jgi:hypothetical protein
MESVKDIGHLCQPIFIIDVNTSSSLGISTSGISSLPTEHIPGSLNSMPSDIRLKFLS